MKNMILTGLIVVSAFSLTQVTNAQKKGVYESKWDPGIVREPEEVLINQMQLDEKSQFLYLISNDDRRLYIDLVVADKAAFQKIMRYGLTTWFNPDAKHKKALGIEFPVTSEGQPQPNFMKDKNADRQEMRKAMMASKNKEMVLIGFGEKGERKTIDPNTDQDFKGKIEMLEGGRIFISISLPLEKLQRKDMASFVNPVSIGFETGYMDVTGQGGMSSGGGGQAGGGAHGGGGGMYGGGGMPGGGPPPGGGSGSMGDASGQQGRPDIGQLASPSKMWIKQVILSKNQ